MILALMFFLMLFLYSLVSARIAKTNLTSPIVFTIGGMLAYFVLRVPMEDQGAASIFLMIAELGLVLLLFTDGNHISYVFKAGLRSLPGRLLSVGMVLTIVLGTLIALVIFGELTIWEAGVLAAILAPTDAGLGQIIVTSPNVPKRIRESLNVEAGLNDGLAVPFLLFFFAMAGGSQDASFGEFFLEQFVYGVVIGLVVGGIGGRLFDGAQNRGWIAEDFQQLSFVVLPLMCVLMSEAVEASMFIAAFVAGLSVPRVERDGVASKRIEFTENWGQLINLTVFFVFGFVAASIFPNLTVLHFLFAVLSLTAIRMIPVAISLIGTGLHPVTIAFMGWFGPRGLASIVLWLVYLEHAHGEVAGAIEGCLVATVTLSIVLHGLTAKPGAALYASRLKSLPADAPEFRNAGADNA